MAATLLSECSGWDPFTGHLFVFFGRAYDRVKALFWDRGSFVAYYKRVGKGRFAHLRDVVVRVPS